MDRARAAALRIPLDLPSVFQGVTRDRTVFVGRPGPDETNRQFLESIGKKPGRPPPSSRSRFADAW